MSNFSDASDAQPRETALQSQLKLGLAALKRKAYPEVIPLLEPVAQAVDYPSVQVKAIMGLVKAYAQTGNVQEAIERCQTLQKHPNPQVQAWADRTLDKLVRWVATSPVNASGLDLESDLSGSEPVACSALEEVARASRMDEPADKTADETGFMPLTSSHRDAFTSNPRELMVDRQSTLPPGVSDFSASSPPREVAADESEPLYPTLELPEDEIQDRLTSEPPIELADHPSPDVPPVAPQVAPIADTQLPMSWTDRTEQIPVGRQAGRAQKWTALGQVDSSKLWGVQGVTVLLLLGIVDGIVLLGQAALNGLFWWFSWIPFLRSVQFEGNPIAWVAIGLGIGFLASPWLLRWILRQGYGLQSFTLKDLATHSPEAARLLKRVSNQHRHSLPRLGLLPHSAPIAFTYGYTIGKVRQTEMVVSQGLLNQLLDDEIATMYASELGHLHYHSVEVMSWVVLVAQCPYLSYQWGATWGNRRRDRALQGIAVFISGISYGVYWCCRLAGLWLSRMRLYYSDRSATELTGNPNGLTRALLKCSLGVATDIQQQQQTSPLLDSFDLLLPIGSWQALTVGSFFPRLGTALFIWDRHHPFRRWLMLNNDHPLLGDRLHLLTLYAHHWRLEAELDWEERGVTLPNRQTVARSRSRFWKQGAPFLGAGLGVLIALLLWLVGWISYAARWGAIDWLWLDRHALLLGLIFLGFGIGTMVRINAFFPDIRSTLESDLAALLTDPKTMPIDSIPVRLQGTLWGRPRFYNRFYQDLILQTPQGAVRLHYTSRLGCIGDFLSPSRRPTDLMLTTPQVTVIGWFRRGATPWIDVETIQPQQGSTLRGGHPVWSTLVAISAALLGIFIIFRG